LNKINFTDFLYPGCAESSKLTVEDQVVIPSVVAACRDSSPQRIPGSFFPRGVSETTRIVSKVEKPVVGLPSKLQIMVGTIPGKILRSPPSMVLLHVMFIHDLLPKAQISPVNHSGE
jgi:hypothetical protein